MPSAHRFPVIPPSWRILLLPALCVVTPWLSAQTARERIYTATDPGRPGGITGRIAAPAHPIEQVVAVPHDQPREAYAGDVLGPDRRAFRFEGLPMNRYDLLVIYSDRFFEGFTLQRGEDRLTDADRAAIATTIERSEPFFTVKIIHRLEGETGRGSQARAICTYLRDRFSIAGTLDERREDHRRTFKLVQLQQVGPGWQIVRARDLYPVYVNPDLGRPTHRYSASLNAIRVTDHVRDIGEIRLSP